MIAFVTGEKHPEKMSYIIPKKKNMSRISE